MAQNFLSDIALKTGTDSGVSHGLRIIRSANSDTGYINYQGGAFRFVATDGDPIKLGHVSNDNRLEINGDGNATFAGAIDAGGNITTSGYVGLNATSALFFDTNTGGHTHIKEVSDDRLNVTVGNKLMLDLGEDSDYIDMHAATVSIHSDVANKPVFNIKNTNADANGAVINLIKDSASPADNDDIGRIYMRGDNDAGEQMEGVMIRGQMTDVSDASEDSKLILYTYGGGSQIASLSLEGSSATFTGNISTAADKRISIGTWDNSAFTGGAAHGYYVSAGTPLLILEESDQSKTGYVGVSGGNMYVGGVIDNFYIQTTDGSNRLTINSGAATFNSIPIRTTEDIGRDAHNRIMFSTDDSIIYRVADTHRFRMDSDNFSPYADSSYDLGTSSLYFRAAYIDAITTTGNVIVGGDLTVNGTTTTVNQTNLDVSDNIIGLNRGAGSNANDSGIIIERGSTGDNAAFLWDESIGYFSFGTTQETASSTGAIANESDWTWKPIKASGAVYTGGIYIGGTTEMTGYAYIAERIVHTGDTDTYLRFVDNNPHFFAGGVNVLDLQASQTSFTGDLFTFASANSTDPLVNIKNTTNDANGARLRFTKDKGAAGADDDVIGQIEFVGDNAAQELTDFAKIEGSIETAADGTEGGRLRLGVASHDGEMRYGLVLHDGDAEDEIDVSIGGGAASVTTVAGDLSIYNKLTFRYNDNHYIQSGTNNWAFKSNSGSVALSLTTGGAAEFAGNISVPQTKKILFDGQSGHTYLAETSDSNLKIYVAATETVNISNDQFNFSKPIGIGALCNQFHDDADDLVVGNGSGNTGMTIHSGTSGYGSIFFADGTADDATEKRGQIRYLQGTERMDFHTDNVATAALSLAANGDATFAGTITSGNIAVTGGSGGNGQVDITRTSGASIRIQSQSALAKFGTTTNHGVQFMTNDTGRWNIQADGHLIPVADSSYDIGSDGTRVRNLYADTLYGDGSNLTNISATDSTKMPLAGGTFTGDVQFNGDNYHLMWDKSANALEFWDNAKLTFGDPGGSPNLELYHDGTHSYIDNDHTGDLYVRSLNDDVVIQGADDVFIYTQGGEDAIIARGDGAVELYYDNSKKFETTTQGATITGNLDTTGSITIDSDTAKLYLGADDDFHVYHTGSHGYVLNKTGALYIMSQVQDGNVVFSADNGEANTTQADYFSLDGGSATHDGSATTALYTKWPDKSRIALGTGKDLQLYHDGSNSYIRDTGTGSLFVQGDNIYFRKDDFVDYMASFVADGAVSLYYDNSKKFETTSAGITVTGSITSTSDITATGADFTLAHAAGATMYIRRDDTSISDGDVIGLLNFQGDDPTDGTFNTGAAIKAIADGTWQSSQYATELVFQTRASGASLATALTLNENQTANFHNTVYFSTSDVGAISWGSMGGGTGFGIRGQSGRALSLGAGGSWDHIIIDTSGNTTFAGGIKVNGPASHNTIQAANDYTLGFNDSNDVNQWWIKAYTDGSFAIHENGVGDKFTIAAAGNATFANQVTIDHNDGLRIKSHTGTYHKIYHNTSTNDLAFSNAAGGDFDFENWVRVRNGAAGTILFEVDSTTGHTGIGGQRSGTYELYVHGATYINSSLAVNGDANITGHVTGKSLTSHNNRGQNHGGGTDQEFPIGHWNEGEEVFSIDPTWTNDQLQNYFGSSSVEWLEDSTAPAGWAIKITNAVNVGGAYDSGFPYIAIDEDAIYYMECHIRGLDSDTSVNHYMGSIDYKEDFTAPSSGSGNPGTYGYWVMSNVTSAGQTWNKRTGIIRGFHNTTTGMFETGAKYWTPQALFNYSHGAGTRACVISGWKVVKISKQRMLADGAAGTPSLTFAEDQDTGMFRNSANSLSLTTGGTQALSIDSSQNATVAGTLTVNNSSQISMTTSTGEYLQFNQNSETMRLLGLGTTWCHILTTSDRFYFDKPLWVDTGNIGSYNEDVQHHRAGTNYARGFANGIFQPHYLGGYDGVEGGSTGRRVIFKGSGDNTIYFGPYDDNGWGYLENYNNSSGMYFNTAAGNFAFDTGDIIPYTDNEISCGGSSNRFTYIYCSQQVRSSGDVVAYYSDERLKDIHGTIPNALEKTLALTGFYYTQNETAKELGYENNEQQVGVSAQEVQKVLPEAVGLAPVDMHYDKETKTTTSKSGKDYLTVKYEKIVPLLIESIKELKAEIEELKKCNKCNDCNCK